MLLPLLIIPMHIEPHRRHIFMTQDFLEAERVPAQLQIPNGKRMTENGWTDPFPGNSCTFFEPLE
jgi:hypothetical protein